MSGILLERGGGGGGAAVSVAAAAGVRFAWSDGGVAARLVFGGRTSGVEVEAIADGAVRVDGRVLGLDLDVVCSWAEWDRPVALPVVTRRTLVVSMVGERGGRWFDGALAHLTARGKLASYLPAGGEGKLVVPIVAAPAMEGAALARALEVEGSVEERTHRCLLGRVGAAVGVTAAQTLSLRAEVFGRREAVALALARQAWPAAAEGSARNAGEADEIELVTACAKSEVPPAWRRLCQNLGVRLRCGVESPASLPLAGLAALIPEERVPTLVASLNAISDVLPKGLTSA